MTDTFANARYVLLKQFDQHSAALRKLLEDPALCNDDYKPLKEARGSLSEIQRDILRLNEAEESARRAAEKLGLSPQSAGETAHG